MNNQFRVIFETKGDETVGQLSELEQTRVEMSVDLPVVARLNIYPVKSFDGVSVGEATVLPSGSLRHDRQFALIDSSGHFINAKRHPVIHQLRLQVEPASRRFVIGRRNGGEELAGSLDEQGKELSDWLSRFFSLEVSIIENDETGFPDDLISPGPTIVSTATLHTVARWFPGLTLDAVRRRFRTNIEVDGVESFWEDRLLLADRQPRPFRVGTILFGGINSCQRCVVPTRDQETGAVTLVAFAQTFRKLREETLPEWSPREHFDHYYRLTTNTQCLDTARGTIRVGDIVEL